MDVWLVMFVLIHSIREMHQQGRNEFLGLIVIVVMKTVMIVIVNRLYPLTSYPPHNHKTMAV